MKIGIISLGCCKNLVDSEYIIGLLKANDIEITTSYEECDAVLINTCGFIEPAKQEAIDTILDMAQLKAETGCKLIVTGCLAQRYKDELIKELPEVDAFISLDEYGQMHKILSEVLQVKLHNTYGKATRVLSGKPWMAYLKIADGCDNKCAYCAIPLIRGAYRSFKMEDLIAEAQRLADLGVKELNLIAQDTTRYGIDLYHERSLYKLLYELEKIEGLKWIRILYMYPDEIDDQLLEAMQKCSKVLPYFDIPIQHANDRLLKLMNRRGSKTLIKQRVAKIRSMFDNAVLRTTIIVGFPSETREEFMEMLDFIKETYWDRLGAFTYSQEEDTPSYEMEDDVLPDEKDRRLNELMDVQTALQEKINQHLIDQELEVMIENYNGLTNMYHARSIYSAPDGIDGEVLFKCDKPLNKGDFALVKIKKIKKHDLIADFVKEVS
ncbi:MAG: 30S ribosomal protein S12 methylthiotransferase RimO [Erysipelotrichaceae bacterium]|nr:30S ribosomal protein S12 methylthiotransferase RimO [Erysipelotrichaceae bacterium]MDY5251756.1 30S ribosomal protein S12 methylthiotransferase RimO [Erysipelotrichaceae bacterium]